MDVSLAILVLVAVMYFLILVGVVIFIVRKRKGTVKGTLKQTIDSKPQTSFKNELKEK